MEIDQDLLIEAVRDSGTANAEEVSAALGPIADDGEYWDVTTVANNLAELESLGKVERTRPLPVVLPQDDSGPQRRDDITQESTEAAADEEEGRPFFQRIGRAVWLPLACVAALLFGYGSTLILLRLGDSPGQSDAKPAPTTAVPAAPPPSAAAPAVTTPPASTSPPAVENEPAPPASAPAPAPPESAPNLNPAGHAPPGQNKKQ